MDGPFFSPRSVQSANSIDWRWLIATIGVTVREDSPNLPLIMRKLLTDKHFMYRSVSLEMTSVTAPSEYDEASSVTYSVLSGEEMANVVGLSLELKNSKGNMELLMVCEDNGGKLHFVPESEFVPMFVGKYERGRGSVVDFRAAMVDLFEPCWKEWRATSEFPGGWSDGIAERLSFVTGPQRLMQDEARYIAREMMDRLGMPYFDEGRLIQANSLSGDKELVIPELSEDHRKREQEEGFALNPEFGALAF